MAAGLALLSACAWKARKAFPDRNADKLETLTSYTLFLSKRDFQSAASMLSPVDRGRLIGTDGKVLPEFQDRLRAMRLTTLATNPLVTLEDGRIRGIFELLPVIDQGVPDPVLADVPSNPAVTVPEDERRKEELRAASAAFFQSIRAREYRKALGMLAPEERNVFLREDGRVKETARTRLAAIDTSSWHALTLEAGKLTGVVLIIPSRPPDTGKPVSD